MTSEYIALPWLRLNLQHNLTQAGTQLKPGAAKDNASEIRSTRAVCVCVCFFCSRSLDPKILRSRLTLKPMPMIVLEDLGDVTINDKGTTIKVGRSDPTVIYFSVHG